MNTIATWTGVSGENLCKEVLSLGSYIYAVLCTSPGKVVKIDPSDMSTTDSVSTTGNLALHLATDGTALYATSQVDMGSYFNVSVDKIQVSDMSIVDTYTYGAGHTGSGSPQFGLTCMGSHVYLGTQYSESSTYIGIVIKIQTSDMTAVGSYSNPNNQEIGSELTNDGTYIYFGTFDMNGMDTARVRKLTSADIMLLVAVWTGPAVNPCTTVGSDNTWVYAGCGDGKVYQIKTSDMSTNASYDYGTFLPILNVCVGATGKLFVAVDTTTAVVKLLNTATMTAIDSWTAGSGKIDPYGVAWDGTNGYVGLSLSPAEVYQLSLGGGARSWGYILG